MPWNHLFRPLQIGSLTLKNRLGFAPNCPVTDGHLTSGVFGEDSVHYYVERAKGGQGLVIIGNSRVSTRTPYFGSIDPDMFDDKNVPWLQRIARDIHKYDSKLFIQLFYTSWGRNTRPQQSAQYIDQNVDLTIPGPSTISNATLGVHIVEMSIEEIERVSEEFADSAERAFKGGVDGVEISTHHLMLHAQFLSKIYNRRTDRYGGSFENRARFIVETLQAVRRRIGDDAVLGYRINHRSEDSRDLSLQDAQEIVRYINKQVKIDYVNVSSGGGSTPRMITPMGYERPGYQMPLTGEIRKVCDVPVFGVGAINSPFQAEDAIAKGQCDLVLMARQLFADPEFANKALEDRPNDIRPCVRYNFCTQRSPFRVGCFQNVAHGREKAWGIGTLKKVAEPKGILVFGGGPAGLETARVLAERGHYVALYEKEERLGGRLRLQARMPLQQEWGNLIGWYEHMFHRLDVAVHLGSRITENNLDSVLDGQGPDAVVVATGSRSRPDGFVSVLGDRIPGADTGMVAPYEDVVEGKAHLGKRILVFDTFSNELALGVSLLLARNGHDIVLTTPYSSIGSDPSTNRNLRGVQLDELLSHESVEVIPESYVTKIDESEVTLRSTHPERERILNGVDGVVLLTQFEPERELYQAVSSRGFPTYDVGDARGFRHVHDAFLEGHRLGRTL